MGNTSSDEAASVRRGTQRFASSWSVLLFGVLVALGVFGLLFVTGETGRQDELRAVNLQKVGSAQAALRELWNRAEGWAQFAAQRLEKGNRNQALELQAQYNAFWPDGNIAFYDNKGDAVVLRAVPTSTGLVDAPLQRTAAPLVAGALAGKRVKEYSEYRGHLAVSAAAPVSGSVIRAVVVSLPLNAGTLGPVKKAAQADIVVFNLDELAATREASTRAVSGDNSDTTLWPLFTANFPKAVAGFVPAKDEATPAVGAGPLTDAGGKTVGVVMVMPERQPPMTVPIWYPALAACAGLVAALLMLLWLRQREGALFTAVAGELAGLAGEGEPARVYSWPGKVDEAFARIASSVQSSRSLVRQCMREHEETRKQLRESCEQQAAQGGAEFRRFFDNAPHGIFRMERDGKFVQVNHAFAAMLGYDSPMLLMTERFSLVDLFPQEGEGNLLLAALSDHPGLRHAISLVQRSGRLRNFSIVSLRFLIPTEDGRDLLEGFLLDTVLEEQVDSLRRQRDRAAAQSSSLALLLAATCQQSQSYLIPGHHCPVPGEESRVAERRKGTNSLKAVFDDIYRIAVAETEGKAPVAAPMELSRLMESLFLQALPAMEAKGTRLVSDLEKDLVDRLSGPSRLLRHALLRTLLAVTAPVQGGCAYIGVARDPNAPRVIGSSRLVFSASWSASEGMPAGLGAGLPGSFAGEGADAVAPEAAQSTGGTSTGAAEAAGEASSSVAGGEQTVQPLEGISLNISEERAVIRFLVQKMRGELLEGVLTEQTRSMQFIVQLEHAVAEEAESLGDIPAAMLDEQQLSQPAASLLAAPQPDPAVEEVGDAAPVMDTPLAGVAEDFGEQAPPLDLLVMDNPVLSESEETPAEGLEILLVDDSLNNRLLFSLFLRDTTHRITEANNGQEGVEAFQRKKFDVIFMDMEMPLMDGYQATRIIRALEADSGAVPTPIVAQTAHALPEFKHQCMLSGCTEFLAKPFSKNALLTMLDGFMQLKTNTEEELLLVP